MAILSILFYCFIAIAIIQILYYIGFLSFFSFQKPEKGKAYDIAISVIICAKNEAENLKQNLPKILEQDYRNFEVVLINDSSWDDTLEVMEEFAEKHDNINLVNVKSIEPFWGNKKYALTLGIKAAKNEFLIFTDADCMPASKQWLKQISAHFSNEKSVILGYGAYKKVKYSLLNKLIRFETLMTAIQYFSYAKLGLPYMGVGRNLAYRKEQFFNNGGYMNHMSIKSGDDDLFINEVATKSNTALCYTKDSFTISEPKKTFKDWIIQKRRHVSTANHYKFSHKLLLGIFYFSQLLFWVLAAILLSFLFQWQIVLGIIAFRIILQFVVIGTSANKLEENDVIILAPFLEIFLIIFQLVIFSANLISKPKHWK
ncbi:glycosyltransferase [Winogradskyella jejuensis]|uniref:Glycosyltransferase, catalytic subunit of cellulose synthase and poly-beta-1,6-N-acetylglucosamine synthase n=1 Tax=Winogradskyella jejuensis TaxID=1089305 RepID=A0A1M5L141_9FLAO|nr:glycosyltransferase [Winogradskyella jejuensis]SHG58665.1 Glycosyltransferase, catalytic subunit of cellulose synthase and poly-beta-1,6-N-acetylglucosamine synthase [Winogradskyella jejuensis]